MSAAWRVRHRSAIFREIPPRWDVYSRTNGAHLSDVARQLIADKSARPALLAALTELSQQT
jgi:hypothetical protein